MGEKGWNYNVHLIAKPEHLLWIMGPIRTTERMIHTQDSGCLCPTKPVTAQKHQIITIHHMLLGSPNTWGPSYTLSACLCCKESYVDGGLIDAMDGAH